VLEDLRRRVAVGELDAGFPTEEELTRDYAVSRHTVREALRRLEADGLLIRERGRGTTLARPQFEQPLRALYSLARTVRSTGLEERSDVRALCLVPAGDAAEVLGVDPRAHVVYLERLRYAGDEPLALDRSWLPADLAEPILHAELSAGSIYDVLATSCGLRVTGGWERIRPLNPSDDERRLLALPAREAVFGIERLALAAGRAVERRHSLVRGDRYSFLAEWDEPVLAVRR
jgi:GntR family transcriptional regulator